MSKSQVDSSMDPEASKQQFVATMSKAYIETAGTSNGRVYGIGLSVSQFYPKIKLSAISST